MKRKTVHVYFVLATLTLTLAVFWQLHKIQKQSRIMAATASVPTAISSTEEVDSFANFPTTRLAVANALSEAGQFEASEAEYIKLMSDANPTLVARDAQFNLANSYLKQGLRIDLPGASTRPLLEIAKQRYRDLLRENPADWDARFNLELALRAAPETSYMNHPKGNPIKSVDVIVPGFPPQDLP